MTALDDILALLRGRKILDETTGTWRVYDSNGVELADPGGVLWRGIHGLLLSNALCCCKVVVSSGPSRSHKQEKYHSVSWSIDWQQPTIKKVEKELPKEYVKTFKKKRDEHKPSDYLLKLLEQLTYHISYLESEVVAIEEKEIRRLEKLKASLVKVVKKQIKEEIKVVDDEEEVIVMIYTMFF